MGGMLTRLGLKGGEAIVHPWINKALEKAQRKVEARNFDTRKNVLRYDDVMNDQRKEVYAQRRDFMKSNDVSETVADMRSEVVAGMVARRIPAKAFAEQWEAAELADDLRRLLNLDLPIVDWAREEGIDEVHIGERIQQAADAAMAAKAANFGPELMRFVEKSLLLQVLDAVWKEHLLGLDHLRQGIGLRAYGQRDPLNEYKSEAFAMFNAMLDELKERVTSMLARVELGTEAPPEPPPPPRGMFAHHPEPVMALAGGEPDYEMADAGNTRLTTRPIRTEAVDPKNPATWRNSPRNAPCPCGSGKKFKHCHGRTM
jgi:preprotein translocase subunit SecA